MSEETRLQEELELGKELEKTLRRTACKKLLTLLTVTKKL